MEQYISKSALVAEIKRYKHKADERLKIKGRTLAEDCKDSALQNLCGNLLHFINTLEVKEVKEQSKDLEEAAKFYAATHTEFFDSECKPHVAPTFIAGAKWQEEQIMKDAIEREVKEDAGGYPYIDATELYDYNNDKPLAKAGDKVKVVIVKDK